MQSTNSIASDKSRTGDVKGLEPALESQENEKSSGLSLPPIITVVEKIPVEKDPFLVQLDQNDPSHPRVCISSISTRWLTGLF